MTAGAVDVEDPLSYIWNSYLTDPQPWRWDCHVVLTFDDPLDPERLSAAWSAVSDELVPVCEAVRRVTGIDAEGVNGPVAPVTKSAGSRTPGRTHPFAIFTSPLGVDSGEFIRVEFVIGGDGAVTSLGIAVSHMVMDGKSMEALVRALGDVYRGSASSVFGNRARGRRSEDLGRRAGRLKSADYFRREIAEVTGCRLGRPYSVSGSANMTQSSALMGDAHRHIASLPAGMSQSAIWATSVAMVTGRRLKKARVTIGVISAGPVGDVTGQRAGTYPLTCNLDVPGQRLQTEVDEKLRLLARHAVRVPGDGLWLEAPLGPDDVWHGGPVLNVITWRVASAFQPARTHLEVVRWPLVEDVMFVVQRCEDRWTLSVVANEMAFDKSQVADLLQEWIETCDQVLIAASASEDGE